LCGDLGSEIVTSPVSVPILSPDYEPSIVFCSKQGSADVSPACLETCLSALESGPVPHPSWGFLLFY